jgi:hypothetical protein
LQLDELMRQGRGYPKNEPGYETQYPTLGLVVGLQPAHVAAGNVLTKVNAKFRVIWRIRINSWATVR